MIPMGPLNSKSFATSISPWVVTTLALEPFACAGPQHSRPTASHLTDVIEKNTYDIHLCASLISPKSASATVICRSELRLLDWTIRDLVAQQTLNGCSIEVGDLLGSGTISGYGHDQHGCLLELNEGGQKEFELNNGEKRIWIEDGDSIQLTGWASDGVGFGECVGVVVPTR
jgi:fumarylacetoacetase